MQKEFRIYDKKTKKLYYKEDIRWAGINVNDETQEYFVTKKGLLIEDFEHNQYHPREEVYEGDIIISNGRKYEVHIFNHAWYPFWNWIGLHKKREVIGNKYEGIRMLSEEEIKEKIEAVNNRRKEFKAYNDIYLAGYKRALQDVLEIKQPKAKPS